MASSAKHVRNPLSEARKFLCRPFWGTLLPKIMEPNWRVLETITGPSAGSHGNMDGRGVMVIFHGPVHFHDLKSEKEKRKKKREKSAFPKHQRPFGRLYDGPITGGLAQMVTTIGLNKRCCLPKGRKSHHSLAKGRKGPFAKGIKKAQLSGKGIQKPHRPFTLKHSSGKAPRRLRPSDVFLAPGGSSTRFSSSGRKLRIMASWPLPPAAGWRPWPWLWSK